MKKTIGLTQLILLFTVVHCGYDYNSNIPDIKIPLFSKEIEKCGSGSEFEKISNQSSSTLLQKCHDVESKQFQECHNKAKIACQKIGECQKKQLLEALFYDQNELKSRLEALETSEEIPHILSGIWSAEDFDKNKCFKSETIEFESFLTTYRVREDGKPE